MPTLGAISLVVAEEVRGSEDFIAQIFMASKSSMHSPLARWAQTHSVSRFHFGILACP